MLSRFHFPSTSVTFKECEQAAQTESLACVAQQHLRFLITFFPIFVIFDLEIIRLRNMPTCTTM